jgi:putative ABC transport system permease protein
LFVPLLKRAKEIDIGKVFGASGNSIMALLSREFLLLVIISFVIAVPIAWYAGLALPKRLREGDAASG